MQQMIAEQKKRMVKKGSNNFYSAKQKRDTRAFLYFVAPAVLAFSFMMLWPLMNLFGLSFFRWDGILKPKEFIGLANFVHLFKDRHFINAVLNTGFHLLVSMPGVLFPAFFLGYFLHRRFRGYGIFRTIFYLPAMISVTGIAMMFVGVYLPDGILNTILKSVGLDSLTRAWLGNPHTVLPAIVLIDLYGGIGFYAVMFFAAFSNIPKELSEAAELDGAGQWRIMWRIYFPNTLGFFGVVSMLHMLYILLDSGQRVLLLTSGGPGDYSLTLGYYLYNQAFLADNLGYSQAIGVFICVVGVLGMLLIKRYTRQDN